MPFDVSIDRQILHTDHVLWILIEILQREQGLFLNPPTGFVEVDSCLVNDKDKGFLLPATAAIESGLMHLKLSSKVIWSAPRARYL